MRSARSLQNTQFYFEEVKVHPNKNRKSSLKVQAIARLIFCYIIAALKKTNNANMPADASADDLRKDA
jgi:hypothetical protein